MTVDVESGPVAESVPTPGPATPPAPADPQARLAVGVFAVVGALSSVYFLVVGRRLWFYNDEWDFLAGRSLGDVRGLLRPHNGHWVTLPIVVYRLLWWGVGLRSYFPYQVLIVALHLLAAWLLRCVLRRAGVSPWVATTAAIVLMLFGSGAQDIVWPFQITYVGAVVFGLTQLLLADHKGARDRRDWLGLAAGGAGLLCSGVAVTMVAVVGIATLITRGRRAAAFHTAPLGLVYLVWYLTNDRGSYTGSGASISQHVHFVVTTPFHALRAMSGYPGGQAPLAVLLVVGLVLVARRFTPSTLTERYALPIAMLVGAVLFLVIASVGRAGSTSAEFRGRYLDVELVLILPALSVAADAVARRGRALTVAVFVLLLSGVPSNLRAADTSMARQRDVSNQYRVAVLTMPTEPLIHDLPRTTRPILHLSVGWFLDGAASGRLPGPGRVSVEEQGADALRLTLHITLAHNAAIAPCRALTEPEVVPLRPREALRVAHGTVQLAPLTGSPKVGVPVTAAAGMLVTPLGSAVTFRMLPYGEGRGVRVCGPALLAGGAPAP